LTPTLRQLASLASALLIAGLIAEVHLGERLPVEEGPLPHAEEVGRPAEAQRAHATFIGVLEQVGADFPSRLRARLCDALLDEGARANLDPLFLLALIGVESRYHLGAESGRGARGLTQLKPSTFAWISAREPEVGGESLESGDDPVVDVRLAARYLAWLEQRFHSRDAALIAYNAGPKNARRLQRGLPVPERWASYPLSVRREYERLLVLAERVRQNPAGGRVGEGVELPQLLASTP
jgi:hypothetical protein